MNEVVNVRSSMGIHFTLAGPSLHRRYPEGYISEAEKRITRVGCAKAIQLRAAPYFPPFPGKHRELSCSPDGHARNGREFYDSSADDTHLVMVIAVFRQGKSPRAVMLRAETMIKSLCGNRATPKQIYGDAKPRLCRGNVPKVCHRMAGMMDRKTGTCAR